MVVMKFGGSSVRDAAYIQSALQIVLERKKNHEVCVVFSAMKGITDLLLQTAELASQGNENYKTSLKEIETRTTQAWMELVEKQTETGTKRQVLDSMLQELMDIFHGVALVKECTARTMDLVAGFGERLNCYVIAEHLKTTGIQAEFIDAREIIRTNSAFGNARVKFEESYKLIRHRIQKSRGIPIITGFVASDESGTSTTLGRNGSDYTASLIGAALQADRVEIWTDVDGVLTANPKIVPNAFVLDEMSIEDAMELAYFGAEVIHPSTMIPAMDRNIDVVIKNTLNPEAPGTRIGSRTKKGEKPITGIASISDAAILNIEGGGMMGMPGVASKVFQVLGDAGVNIIMISQASSEHSICIVCREQEAHSALEQLNTGLAKEVRSKIIQRIDMKRDLEIVAVVGDNMRGTPGISGRLFSSLGNAGINILAIAQGSSERNISFVIEKHDRDKALQVVHKAFLEE